MKNIKYQIQHFVFSMSLRFFFKAIKVKILTFEIFNVSASADMLPICTNI